MVKRHVAARRQQLRHLAEQERRRRCAHCRRVLDFQRIQIGDPFCSSDCAEDHAAWFEAREKLRMKVTQ